MCVPLRENAEGREGVERECVLFSIRRDSAAATGKANICFLDPTLKSQRSWREGRNILGLERWGEIEALVKPSELSFLTGSDM